MASPVELQPTNTVFKVLRNELITREQKRGDTWPVDGRDYFDYMSDFSCIVNQAVLERRLERIKSPVVIDLMASTEALESLFNHLGNPKESLGIAIRKKENRDKYRIERNENAGIYLIEGDLLHTSTWDNLNELLIGQKANLIMEDGLGAWEFIPKDKRLLKTILSRTWNLLSPNHGTLLAEIPNAQELKDSGINMSHWRDLLLRNGIDFEYAHPTRDRGFLRLTKYPDSPIHLPAE